MSLYGALFSGVSGLKSQANKLGVISDNISNVNTVGYKGGMGSFETLVTSSTSTAAYSPGGVIGGNRQLVSKQGLLQATDTATDIAISGNGFFVVNQNADDSGQVFYTRAGSFRADSTGNFRNAAGFYLQAWPLDREGRLPGAAGNTVHTTSSANLNSLQTVNVQNLTGAAAATSAVSIGANLNSAQTIFPGSSGTIDIDHNSTTNFGIAAKDIIVPNAVNHISRGDKMDITTGAGLTYTYRYGGFTFSRNVTDGSVPDSGQSLLTASTSLSTNPFAVTPGSNIVTVTQPSHGLVDGAVVSLSGNTQDIAGIPASEFNGNFVIDVIDANHFTIQTATSARAATTVTPNSVQTTAGSVTIDVGASGLFSVGQSITVAGSDVVNGMTINGTHTITGISGSTVTWADATTPTPPVLAAHAFSNTASGSDSIVTVDVGTSNSYAIGDTITIAGADSINGVNPNGTWTVTGVSGNNVSFHSGQASATATLGNNPITAETAALNPIIDVDLGVGGAANYHVNDTITISGASTTNGVNVNGTWTISSIVGDVVKFTATGQTATATTADGGASVAVFQATGGGAVATDFQPAGGGASAITAAVATAGGATIADQMRPFAGNILDATNTETRFLSSTGTAGFTTAALSFNITTPATGTVTFSYTSASPDVRQKQFNNLTNLAASINEVTGLSARVVNNQLYVGATDANAAVTFTNGSTVGTSGPPVQAGIDWVRELGLQDIGTGTNRFSSMQGLYNLATTDAGISASIVNPLGAATLKINTDNPLDTIHFGDSSVKASLPAFTSPTPITTTAGSSIITVTHPSVASGFSTGDFVTLNAAAMANTTILGAAPITTTSGANATVTVDTTGTGQTYVVGQKITIAGATTVNGVNANGTWTITAVSGNNVSFATTQTSSGVAAGGGAAATAGYGSFNGIDLSALSGRYEITMSGAFSYTIDLGSANAATASGSTGAAGLVVTPHNNLGSLVDELGLTDTSLAGGTYTPQQTGNFGPAYSPTDATLNMASGSVAPQFSRPIRIYDALGTGHDLNVAFLKTDTNTWAIEVYAVPTSDVSTSLPNGLVAYGNVTFNGDGTLKSVDNTLSAAVPITWTSGATASAVTFNWGTAGPPFGSLGATVFGQADGLSQYNAAYKVSFANQNGAPVGELTGVSITELGIVVASYSNGETQNLYQIPVADFANPDQLTSSSGNVFAQSADSGEFNLRQANTSGVGKIAASSLEASNVELSSELTDMIIAQRSYQANAKVISTSDNMLDELNQIIR